MKRRKRKRRKQRRQFKKRKVIRSNPQVAMMDSK